jgi:hypothetical protein
MNRPFEQEKIDAHGLPVRPISAWAMRCAFTVFWVCALLLCTAVLADERPAPGRPFRFPADALAFANQLSCDYELNPSTGKMVEHRRVPKPSYTLHCFVVARTARQFFQHAHFEPNEPKATPAVYRNLVRLILARSPRVRVPDQERIVIPGYSSLHDFSEDYEAVLKAESGGAWQSFLQRGNWRMVFPFSRRHQRLTAQRLAQALQQDRPPLVHLVCFPALTLNHVVLLFDFKETEQEIEFMAYDPNQPGLPIWLVYERGPGRFYLPQGPYFAGGPVKVYEICRGLCY